LKTFHIMTPDLIKVTSLFILFIANLF